MEAQELGRKPDSSASQKAGAPMAAGKGPPPRGGVASLKLRVIFSHRPPYLISNIESH